MKATDFRIGQRVIITGKIYHGSEGRVHSVGNGTVFVLGRFSKGMKNAKFPRGFMPEDVASLDSEAGLEVLGDRTSKENLELGPDARYGGADVV